MMTDVTVTAAPDLVAARSRRAPVGWALALTAAYAALLVCACVPTAAGLAIAALAVTAVEALIDRVAAIVGWALQRVGLGLTARALVRGVALVLFASRATSTRLTILTALVVIVIASANASRAGLADVISYWRKAPVLSRGLALGLTMPRALTRRVADSAGAAALPELVAAIGLSIASGRNAAIAVVGLALAAALAWTTPTILARHALALRKIGPRQAVPTAVQRALLDLQPEVALYFGSAAEWTYQVDMWLATVEELGRPAIVIVRERNALTAVAPTGLPVVCAPTSSALMQLELPALRAVLYVGNTANSIHLLRRPGLTSVFIGHGDSDKAASSNPFARAYREIWVAGPAGRARYVAADLAIAAEAIVEVGRPQLAPLTRDADAVPQLTVLYAPTWEGWGEDPFHSSLAHVGPALIQELLARPGLRVMYRPHPQTGWRDARVRRAHAAIVELMRAAGAHAPDLAALRPGPAARRAGDLLDLATGPQPAWSREHERDARQRWNEAYWTASPGHRLLVAPAPDLHATLRVTDVLIADVSSVTTDFLAADRPYAIVNATNDTAADFRRRTPSASGGFVLDATLSGLDDLLAAAAPGPDPTSAARHQARDYLLGPATADPAAAFRAAVDRVCER